VSGTGGRWEKAAEAYATGEHKAGRELELVVEYAAPTGKERVLDIGTGAGHTALALAPRVSDVVLTDPVDAMLADVEARLSPFGRDSHLTETLLSAAQIVRRQSATTSG